MTEPRRRPPRQRLDNVISLRAHVLDEPLSIPFKKKGAAEGLLKEYGLRTSGDLIRHYPRRYIEFNELTVLDDLPVNENVTLVADVGYVMGNEQYRRILSNSDTGFQHYDIGLIGHYSLNTLFNFPRRYGEFALEGYLYYTDGIDNDLRADTQVWGGVGINFKY